MSKQILHSTFLFLLLLCFGCGPKSDQLNRVKIIASYEGASPEEVEQSVTDPIEKAFRDLQASSISSPGICVITISAALSLDSLRFLVKARMPDKTLPQNMYPPVVMDHIDPNTVIRYVVKSDLMPLTQLRKWQEEELKTELETMPKVKAAYTVGSGEQVIRISPDLYKLQAFDITLEELSGTLDRELYSVSSKLSGLSTTAIKTPEDLLNMVIRSDKNNTVLLKDLAQVSLTVKEGKQAVFSGNAAALEGVVAFSNDLPAAEREKQFYEVLNKVQKKMPAGISVTPFWGTSTTGTENCLQLKVQFPAGSAKESVNKATHRIRQLIADNAGVTSLVSETGFSMNGDVSEEDLHTFFIATDQPQKKETIENNLQEKLDAMPGISFWFVHNTYEYPAGYCIKISSSEKENLPEVIAACREKLKLSSGISNIHVQGSSTVPQMNYKMDREKMNACGIPAAQLQKTIDLYRNGRTWNLHDETVIELKLPETDEPLNLNFVKIKSMSGTVPLKQFVSLEMNAAPSVILHENGLPLAKVCFTVKNEEALKTTESLLQGIKTAQGVVLRLEKEE